MSPTTTTTRALRANLREMLELAAAGREIVVTLRGKPYVRIVPITAGDEAASRYPLRGSVLEMADDFDAPAPETREAQRKKPAKPQAAAARSSSRGAKRRKAAR